MSSQKSASGSGGSSSSGGAGFSYKSSGTNSQVHTYSLPILTHPPPSPRSHHCQRKRRFLQLNQSTDSTPSRETIIVPATTPPEVVNPRIPIVITTPTQTVRIITSHPRPHDPIVLPLALLKRNNKTKKEIFKRHTHEGKRLGSYYYSNPSGSTYYNDGQGGSKYTPPSGKK